MAGWALGQAGLKTTTRKGLAALILGANMPDIDVFFGNAPWDPLAIHRGFTHGIVGGVLVMPPILAGLLWLLDRWQIGRGATFKSGLPMRFGWLVALCYLGALTHPLLDMLTTYSVQLLSPFSNRWYHADGLFIIDVWLWLLLAIGIGVSKRREQKGREWRRLPQVGDRDRARLHRREPAHHRAGRCRGPRMGRRARRSRRSSPRRRRSPSGGATSSGARTVATAAASYDPLGGGFGTGQRLPADQHGRPDRPRGDPARSRASEVPQMVDPAAGRRRRASAATARVAIGDARYGEGRRSRLARETVVPTPAAGLLQNLDNSRPNS